MNIKIHFIGVLLFVLAIVVFAGALDDLKYYEFEYFNLQELCLSASMLLIYWWLATIVMSVDRLFEKLNENDQLREKEIQKDIDFARKVHESLREYQSIIDRLKSEISRLEPPISRLEPPSEAYQSRIDDIEQQLLDIQNKK
ncbi:septal ring factor EnvC (AmiA/AmiB activator) [Runella defluvii]|uniref:Septal ring factor EnvC (AmiA/AmiB activator) n=1 Tax=Runella defluvii TaxID=370973 RepID=A0A7W5ZQV4_9BACT|nr:hypothetical protein [Runella defluvii]MBB3841105.1 septal ring factor EnvC (AmiA/AmiB activator) [Runella defluvii]